MNQNSVLRDIYISDSIVGNKEVEMLECLDKSCFDTIEQLYQSMKEETVLLTNEELKSIEDQFYDFYLEYGYVQFIRGLELGLSLRNI